MDGISFDTLLRAAVLIIPQGVLKRREFKKRFLSETTSGTCQSVDVDELKKIEMDRFTHGTQSVQQLSVIGLLLWCGWVGGFVSNLCQSSLVNHFLNPYVFYSFTC